MKKRSEQFGTEFWGALSPKLMREVQFFSPLHYDYWILLETNPKVKSFCEKPWEIKVLFQGEWIESIFDMWVLWENGEEFFIKIVREEELEKDNRKYLKTQKQIGAQLQWCFSEGKNHQIITNKEIRNDSIFLANSAPSQARYNLLMKVQSR